MSSPSSAPRVLPSHPTAGAQGARRVLCSASRTPDAFRWWCGQPFGDTHFSLLRQARSRGHTGLWAQLCSFVDVEGTPVLRRHRGNLNVLVLGKQKPSVRRSTKKSETFGLLRLFFPFFVLALRASMKGREDEPYRIGCPGRQVPRCPDGAFVFSPRSSGWQAAGAAPFPVALRNTGMPSSDGFKNTYKTCSHHFVKL